MLPRPQCALFIGQVRLVHGLRAILPLHPPRKKVPHHPRLHGLHPLFVKAPAHALRRRLQDQFSLRRQRRAQSRQRLRRIARPPRQLAAMQILHRQSTPRILLPRRHHKILRIHLRKCNRPRARARSPQRPRAHRIRQALHKPVHDAENLLRRLLRVRNLQRQCPRPRHRPQEKPRSRPRRQSQLPRLQHDVPLPPPSLKCPLHRIQSQRLRLPLTRPHSQHLRGKRHQHCLSLQARRPPVQNRSEPNQLLPRQLLRRRKPRFQPQSCLASAASETPSSAPMLNSHRSGSRVSPSTTEMRTSLPYC